MRQFKTEQERFWAGQFGDEYIGRNVNAEIVASNLRLFSEIIGATHDIKNVLELGANIGLNLIALRQLLPGDSFSAIEINAKACKALRKLGWVQVEHSSIVDYQPKQKYDLILAKGVLIHINPEELDHVYRVMYAMARKYICIVEYYNPVPVEVNYRGHSQRLFKRDFGGDMLHKFKSLKLVDYGFCYHLDDNFPQDDLNWFLLEKRGG